MRVETPERTGRIKKGEGKEKRAGRKGVCKMAGKAGKHCVQEGGGTGSLYKKKGVKGRKLRGNRGRE